MSKICRNCKRDLPVLCYKQSENSDDGLFPMCIACANLLREKQLENYYRYFPKYAAPWRNVGLSDFVRKKCHDSVWRGKIHG